MGYEIKIYVGKRCLTRPEIKLDTDRPLEDGSGFPYKKDAGGEYIKTGRIEHYFMSYGHLDLCKLGHQDDALNRLIRSSFDEGKKKWKTEFVYFYGEDGNKAITEDSYGSHFWPVSVPDVLAAMRRSLEKRNPYRRLQWAIALLESMKDDKEETIEAIFYGH